MSKLDDLCAIKVMGWTRESPLHEWKTGNGMPMVKQTGFSMWSGVGRDHFHPSTSVSDALLCLERAAGGLEWYLNHSCYGDDLGESMRYECSIENYAAEGSTAVLAMCLCSLRAMGVPESEIQAAMEGK